MCLAKTQIRLPVVPDGRSVRLLSVTGNVCQEGAHPCGQSPGRAIGGSGQDPHEQGTGWPTDQRGGVSAHGPPSTPGSGRSLSQWGFAVASLATHMLHARHCGFTHVTVLVTVATRSLSCSSLWLHTRATLAFDHRAGSLCRVQTAISEQSKFMSWNTCVFTTARALAGGDEGAACSRTPSVSPRARGSSGTTGASAGGGGTVCLFPI